MFGCGAFDSGKMLVFISSLSSDKKIISLRNKAQKEWKIFQFPICQVKTRLLTNHMIILQHTALHTFSFYQLRFMWIHVQWNVITLNRVLTKSFRHITRTSASTILQDTSKITPACVYTLILTRECHLSIDRGVLCIIQTEWQLGHSLPPQNQACNNTLNYQWIV